MRALRWFVASAVLGSVLAIPTTAMANGGAYIEFRSPTAQGRGTHFLSGGSATGVATVYVPPGKEFLFQQGPFYAFLLPSGAELREGRPIPASAIRLGTFSIAHQKGTRFDLTVEFTVPRVPGDFYTVSLCNEPCTVSGFRESLTSPISIVATIREARLLTEQARLRSRLSASQRDLRKLERQADGVQLLLDLSEQDAAEVAAQAEARAAELGRALAAARARAREANPLAAWVVGLAALSTLAVAALLILRRRWRAAFVVPDTIEEFEPTIRAER